MRAATVTRPPNLRSDQYPPELREWARDAYERGHTVKQIKAALGAKGYRPSWSTVIRWVDSSYGEAEAVVQVGQRMQAWWARRRRMNQLRDLGTSYRSIAAIVNHDFGLELSENDARYIIQDRYAPAKTRRLLGAAE